MAFMEIPLSSGAQSFTVTLGDNRFKLRFIYLNAVGGGWFMDVESLNKGRAVYGVPLVCGVDLFSQYQHLGFGHFYAVYDGDKNAEPSYSDMGKALRLYWSDEDD